MCNGTVGCKSLQIVKPWPLSKLQHPNFLMHLWQSSSLVKWMRYQCFTAKDDCHGQSKYLAIVVLTVVNDLTAQRVLHPLTQAVKVFINSLISKRYRCLNVILLCLFAHQYKGKYYMLSLIHIQMCIRDRNTCKRFTIFVPHYGRHQLCNVNFSFLYFNQVALIP